MPLLRGPDADPPALLAFGAGCELELADLFAGERGAGEGVVLVAAEHVPGDHGELARDRDSGDVAAAAAGDSLVEGAQRSGGARGVPGCFDEHVPCLAGALFADPSVPGRLRTRLTHARVEAEVTDELARCGEAVDIADRGEQRGGGDEVHAGQGEQSP